MKLNLYNGDKLCTSITADFEKRIVEAENYTDVMIFTAFGRNQNPTWEDFEFFLKERCMPETRAGLREYLEDIGVGEYDPLAIIRVTQGRMAEDNQYIEIID